MNIEKITLNGNEYNLADLPADIQDLIKIYFKWQGELDSQRVELFKTEAAIKALTLEITNRMTLAQKAAEEAAAAQEPAIKAVIPAAE